jgi:hypothetical protein
MVETSQMVSFETIARLTDKQIVLANGRRFRRHAFRAELSSDNGHGYKTNRGARLVDPADPYTVAAFARQQLRAVAYEASQTTHGSNATVHTMDPDAVRAELDRIRDVVNAAGKEIDRRARL